MSFPAAVLILAIVLLILEMIIFSIENFIVG